jgi:hypothetical protein
MADTRKLFRDAIFRQNLTEFKCLASQYPLEKADIKNHMLATIKHGADDIFIYLSTQIYLSHKDIISMFKALRRASHGCITRPRLHILVTIKQSYDVPQYIWEQYKSVGWDRSWMGN